MTMPMGQQGAMPDTCYETPMAEGGAVDPGAIGDACVASVDAAISQRQQEGRNAGL